MSVSGLRQRSMAANGSDEQHLLLMSDATARVDGGTTKGPLHRTGSPRQCRVDTTEPLRHSPSLRLAVSAFARRPRVVPLVGLSPPASVSRKVESWRAW